MIIFSGIVDFHFCEFMILSAKNIAENKGKRKDSNLTFPLIKLRRRRTTILHIPLNCINEIEWFFLWEWFDL